MKHPLRIVVLFFALLVSLPHAVFAADTMSLQIAPTTIEQNIDPGTDIPLSVKAKNTGTIAVTLYPNARNITGIGADQHPIYSTDANDQNYDIASWVTYTESSLALAPGDTKELHFIVHVPKDAQPGSHMAGIFLADKPSSEVKLGSAIAVEIGSILNLQIAGDIIQDTRIREFFSAKTIYGTPDVNFTVTLENFGNVFTRPRGLIDITDMFGKKVDSIPVNESAAGVFPKTTREFTAEWKPEGLAIGHYEAVIALSVSGPQGDQTISRVVQFWILPMNILMPVLGGLLILILVVFILLRLYVRRQLAGSRSQRTATQGASGLSRLAAVVIGLLVAIIIGLLILFLYFG